MSLKTIAVIPVHGRLPLLKYTIKRLYDKNKVSHIICIGSSDDERNMCISQGAEFIRHANKPLGKKWNAGYLKAKEYNPDAVVYVGSSDWLSDNWLPVIEQYIGKYDIIGKRDYNLAHIDLTIRAGHWPHYPTGSAREDEPIGIGRVLSRSFLDRINWQPFDDHLPSSMDYSMLKKLMDIGGTCFLFNSPEIQSLSVSCDKWENMHLTDFNSIIEYQRPQYWLHLWFPDIFDLKNDLSV